MLTRRAQLERAQNAELMLNVNARQTRERWILMAMPVGLIMLRHLRLIKNNSGPIQFSDVFS